MPYEKIGGWAFILGVLIAVVAGLATEVLGDLAPWVTLILVVLGLVVGVLNIGDKEVNEFLIAAIALSSTSMAFYGVSLNPTTLGALANLFRFLTYMVGNVAAFVAPAALVVALKVVYNLASKPTTAR